MAEPSIARVIKDPDAAAAKRVLERLLALAPRLAAARGMFPRRLDVAERPGPSGTPKSSSPTTLGRWFFPEVDQLLDAIESDLGAVEVEIGRLGL